MHHAPGWISSSAVRPEAARVGRVGLIGRHHKRSVLVAVLRAAIEAKFVVVELEDTTNARVVPRARNSAVSVDIALTRCRTAPFIGRVVVTAIPAPLVAAAACQGARVFDIKDWLAIVDVVLLESGTELVRSAAIRTDTNCSNAVLRYCEVHKAVDTLSDLDGILLTDHKGVAESGGFGVGVRRQVAEEVDHVRLGDLLSDGLIWVQFLSQN